jgi:hypothetical protein
LFCSKEQKAGKQKNKTKTQTKPNKPQNTGQPGPHQKRGMNPCDCEGQKS